MPPTMTVSGGGPKLSETQWPAVSTTVGAISVPEQPCSPEEYNAAASGHSPSGAALPPITGASSVPAIAVRGKRTRQKDSAYRMAALSCKAGPDAYETVHKD